MGVFMITGRTKLFCIVADPIAHVKTPEMFNAHLDRSGIDAVLVPVHVTPEGLAEVVRGLRDVSNLRGIVVTVPHKISILDLCDDLHSSAGMVGAANILRRGPDGRLTGANFDGIGFRRSLEDAMGSIAGKSVYLAGAGGVARAIAFSMAEAGVSRLSVYNRSREKGEELLAAISDRFPAVATSLSSDTPQGFDIAINATSLGLKPDDNLPFTVDALSQQAVVADVVMEPIMTGLLLAAQKRGLQIVTGDAMLMFQLQSWVEFIEDCPSLGAMPNLPKRTEPPAAANGIGYA
jgi:shikimate dehydrogenase